MSASNDFLPQYAARAVVDLEATAKRLDQRMSFYRAAVTSAAAMIRSAVHVVLPANGEIYRSNAYGGRIPSQDECDSFDGIPAPIVCFQYPWNLGIGESETTSARAPKRITIVVDGKQAGTPSPPTEADYRSIVYLFSVFFDERHAIWLLGDVAMAIGQPLRCVMSDSPRGYWHWSPMATVRNMVTGEIVVDETRGRTYSTQIGELRPDLTAVVQCCHALRAGARLEERTEQSASRRRKFERMGVGGFTYHILKLPHNASVEKQGSTGSHASPRFHIRRAHIRKLPSGALTFVRQCFVGDPSRGTVAKHYKVQPS